MIYKDDQINYYQKLKNTFQWNSPLLLSLFSLLPSLPWDWALRSNLSPILTLTCLFNSNPKRWKVLKWPQPNKNKLTPPPPNQCTKWTQTMTVKSLNKKLSTSSWPLLIDNIQISNHPPKRVWSLCSKRCSTDTIPTEMVSLRWMN